MADAFDKTVAFLAAYSQELVQMKKPTLTALLNSKRRSQVPEWERARNFCRRKLSSLEPAQQQILEDWEFVLCDKSTLEAAPFLAGLQRCFCRVEAFLTETAEAIRYSSRAKLAGSFAESTHAGISNVELLPCFPAAL